ncbi:hypothetical protein [Parasitella parasitica]|uniref:EF-hand domain-containing protein n=1 Tax=Parasitella parasitica TaxID=35722 RepID=A0A0B7MYD0_9FUNG|nr:hypothetical protein [Parasitella parasitica]
MRASLVFIVLSLMVTIVHGGPGQHQFATPHSNYGDGKKNKHHIQEHMKSMTKSDKDDVPDLGEQDMIYYLFVIHDINGDGYLDGHELRAAFTDFDEHDGEDPLTLQEVTEMVDHVLLEDDKNGDGLISWSEYLESQLYHDD